MHECIECIANNQGNQCRALKLKMESLITINTSCTHSYTYTIHIPIHIHIQLRKFTYLYNLRFFGMCGMHTHVQVCIYVFPRPSSMYKYKLMQSVNVVSRPSLYVCSFKRCSLSPCKLYLIC